MGPVPWRQMADIFITTGEEGPFRTAPCQGSSGPVLSQVCRSRATNVNLQRGFFLLLGLLGPGLLLGLLLGLLSFPGPQDPGSSSPSLATAETGWILDPRTQGQHPGLPTRYHPRGRLHSASNLDPGHFIGATFEVLLPWTVYQARAQLRFFATDSENGRLPVHPRTWYCKRIRPDYQGEARVVNTSEGLYVLRHTGTYLEPERSGRYGPDGMLNRVYCRYCAEKYRQGAFLPAYLSDLGFLDRIGRLPTKERNERVGSRAYWESRDWHICEGCEEWN
ncbi:hypothetical protein JHW43_005398 [Diplocarpon mali]|nr:hypothetical protein JHW43_005398 [Diplocarpon mali]